MGRIGLNRKKIMEQNSKYWQNFYSKDRVTHNQSSFADECITHMTPGRRLIDIGCGNGRDSTFFSDYGLNVISVDQSFPEEMFSKKCFYIKTDICDLQNINCDYIYARFFIHAITVEQQYKFFEYIRNNCTNFFIEARSDKSAFEGDHYRRFINMNDIQHQLNEFKFEYNISEDIDRAITKTENPYIIRIFGKNKQ